MAGHTIAQYLIQQGHSVTGFARAASPVCDTITGDARNETDIMRVLNGNSYDVVVNCVGVLNRFVDANLSDGIYLNSVLPHFLARCLEGTKTKLIHISTDCVFEGDRGLYKETDIPDATSYYGRSKALGEVIDCKNLTIRTSIVGPELKTDGIGLFHWFMNQDQTVDGYKKVIWSGVTTLQLAKAIEADAIANRNGIYHLVNNDVISKFHLLELFNKYCRKRQINIRCNTKMVSDKSLYNTCMEPLFEIPHYEQMIKELVEWIKEHPALYRQYADKLEGANV